MTPNTTPLSQSKSSPATTRATRRLSPEFSELLHMLSSLEAKSPPASQSKD